MNIRLTAVKTFTFCNEPAIQPVLPDGWVTLDVSHCGICRTDAKMWEVGHRDLVLPRVLGHEIIAHDSLYRYAIWPGIVCGSCPYCKSGRENLCDSMQIIGFHHDGGFGTTISVPGDNCITVPQELDSVTATLAEPAGCIIHAFDKVRFGPGSRVLVYGGGTMGLIASIVARHYGAEVGILEHRYDKIEKAKTIDASGYFNFVKSANCTYDIIMLCCADYQAFISSIKDTAKGSSVIFFSGLGGNQTVDTATLNSIHYKELSLTGSYGLTKKNICDSLELLSKHQTAFKPLVEKVLHPDEVGGVMPVVLSGDYYRFVLAW
jgi:nicotinate-nucleotide--dimethylbenzimidazole phosphoribosyltransferase